MAQLINAIVSGNLTITGKLNGYNIGSAIERGVDTSIVANSTKVPTSQAIIDYVSTAITTWRTNNTFNSVTTGTNASDNQVTDVIVPNGYSAGFNQALPKGWVTTSGTANVSASNIDVAWDTTENKFKVSGNLAASGTAAATVTPGYILTGNKTQNNITTGTQTWSGNTLNTVGTDVDFDSADFRLVPVISDFASSLSGKTKINVTPQTDSNNVSTDYYISVGSIENSSSLSATPKVSSAGFGDSSHHNATTRYKTVGAAQSATTYLPIPTAVASISFTGAPSPIVSNKNLSASGKEQIAFSAQNSTNNWGTGYDHFYLGIEAAYSTGTVNVSKTITTPGYLSKASELPSTASLTGASSDFYAPIKTGLLGSCTKAEGETGPYASYLEYNNTNFSYVQTTPALVSEGYLIINEGYYKNSKISLGQLIGDIVSGDALPADMLYGTKAYNEAGVLMTGTIPKHEPSSVYYTTTNTGLGELVSHSYIDKTSNLYIKSGSIPAAQFTTTNIAGNNLQLVDSSGWIGSTYLDTITLPNSKQIKINDGIATWTISKDSSGNVTIS